MRYDIVVVGNGPAGLSAALNAKIRNKKVLVLAQNDASPKIKKSHRIDNYLGLFRISGEEFAKRTLEQVREEGVEIRKEHVEGVYAMGDFFNLMLRSNEVVEATVVILATGVEMAKPIPGEEEFLGKGVGYCATCDAALYVDRPVVVIGMNEEAAEEANFIAERASETTFINRTGSQVQLREGIQEYKERPLRIEGDTAARKLILPEREIEADGFFIIRDSKKADQLVPGLKTEGAHIPVDGKQRTNLPGLYAAGDITGKPYQIAKAVGEGQVAALEAVQYLSKIQKRRN